MQNIGNSIKFSKVVSFFAGPSLAGLATVSVLLFEKEEYFHSTSHYSSRRQNTSTLQVTLSASTKPKVPFPSRENWLPKGEDWGLFSFGPSSRQSRPRSFDSMTCWPRPHNSKSRKFFPRRVMTRRAEIFLLGEWCRTAVSGLTLDPRLSMISVVDLMFLVMLYIMSYWFDTFKALQTYWS